MEFDFSSDEAARESMKQFIRENFSELLGEKIEWLDQPGGIERIKSELQEDIHEAGRQLPQNMKTLLNFLQGTDRTS